jgi:alkylation response protein AidB-like acyl-CoA dehydrogenase
VHTRLWGFHLCPQVPKANIVGKAGDAVLHMMRNLELERLALAGMSLGIARRCIEVRVGSVVGVNVGLACVF